METNANANQTIANTMNGYEILRKLGSGAYGRVLLARKNNQFYALKVLMCPDETTREAMVRSENMSRLAESPRIAALIEMFTWNGLICLVYQFAENGDMFDYIEVRGALPLPVFKAYAG